MKSTEIAKLDEMSSEALMEFWSRYHHPTRKDAEELVGNRRPGYTNIAATLANYACNRSVAVGCRLKGDIQAATIYEHSMELCYNRLPEDLRW